MIDMLRELCMLDGVSGREEAVRRYVCEKLESSPFVKSVKVDALGNVLAFLPGDKSTKETIMIAAHMDEVGVIATGFTEDGFVRFATVGGIDKSVLFGHRVRFRETVGIIGGKAIHMCKSEEKDKLPDGDLLIDIGASSKDEAMRLVSYGDTAVFDSEFYELGHLVKGRAIDDRAGCAVLLSLAQSKPACDVWLCFTVQEEVGLRGAKTAAFTVDPTIGIVIDATTAADTVGVAADKQVCKVGGGAVVSFMDRRTLYDKALYDEVMALAEKRSIPAQPKSMVAGGNDAGSLQSAAHGARVAAISLPCRYIHSPSCVASPEDLRVVKELVAALIERLAR